MYTFEVKKIIGENFKEDDDIVLWANGIRITGIILDYDDDYIKIKSDGEIITLDYSDIEEV